MKSYSKSTFLLFLTLVVLGGCTPTLKSQVKKQNFKPLSYGDWRPLGPFGMPNLVSLANTYGVGQANRLAFDPW